MLIYMIGFIAFFAFSQGTVIWVFISEIFPNTVRAKGQALGKFYSLDNGCYNFMAFPNISRKQFKRRRYSIRYFRCYNGYSVYGSITSFFLKLKVNRLKKYRKIYPGLNNYNSQYN